MVQQTVTVVCGASHIAFVSGTSKCKCASECSAFCGCIYCIEAALYEPLFCPRFCLQSFGIRMRGKRRNIERENVCLVLSCRTLTLWSLHFILKSSFVLVWLVHFHRFPVLAPFLQIASFHASSWWCQGSYHQQSQHCRLQTRLFLHLTFSVRMWFIAEVS